MSSKQRREVDNHPVSPEVDGNFPRSLVCGAFIILGLLQMCVTSRLWRMAMLACALGSQFLLKSIYRSRPSEVKLSIQGETSERV